MTNKQYRRCMGAAIIAMLVATTLTGCRDASTRQAAVESKTTVRDGDYAAALAVANRFCHTWLNRDVDGGRALLTKRFIRQYPEQQIRDAIAGLTSPRHEAYEISQGQKKADGQFQFQVRLLLVYEGQRDNRIESPQEQITVVRSEAGVWQVDGFPVP